MAATTPIKIAVAGASGRMGRALIDAAEARDDVLITARFDRPDVRGDGLVAREKAIELCDVVVDFSAPPASAELAEWFAERGGPPLVIGSTGFTAKQERKIQDATTHVPILRSGNFSLGINLILGFVRTAASMLPPERWDIEIFEAHHRHKIDSPSGTALLLGEASAEGRDVDLETVAVFQRHGNDGPRKAGEIGFQAIRAGGIIGDHSVLFASESESFKISHSARNRSLFADGALEAAKWIIGRPPGLYDMQHVLGFKEVIRPD